jgi:hypothetical protein
LHKIAYAGQDILDVEDIIGREDISIVAEFCSGGFYSGSIFLGRVVENAFPASDQFRDKR